MVRGKGGQMYDEDDYYDEEEDGYDDYDEEYDGYDEVGGKPAQTKGKQAGKGAASTKSPAPAAAAAPKTPASKQPASNSFPVAPTSTPGDAKSAEGSGSKAPAAPAPAAFKFDTPSPDDRVLAAQQGRTGGTALPGSSSGLSGPPSLPQSKAMAGPPSLKPSGASLKPAPLPSYASSGASAADAVLAMRGLNVGAAQEPGAGAGAAPGAEGGAAAAAGRGAEGWAAKRRPLSDYSLEPDLARECEALAAIEHSGEGGSKPSLHLVVLGHVDAGKSSLMGRLLHDLGYVSQKEAHKNAREAAAAGKGSFSWAWVLDERPEERARGVTVDIALSRFATPRFSVTLMDAPGHRDFVPNMISGAAQADAALLLVDGSPGGFEAGMEGSGIGQSGGQTREHAQLARSLGVEQVAVVVSKLDMADYSEERFLQIQSTLLPFLKSIGFKESLIQWLPAVGPLGENLVSPPSEPRLKAWWRGPTAVQAIDAFTPRERNTGRPLRLPIADVTRGRGGGAAVGGKLEAGAIRPGGRMLLVPSWEAGVAKAVEVDGKPANIARAGDSVDVTLQGIDPNHLAAGAVLCHPDYPVPLVTKFEARVVVLDVVHPVLKGHQVTLHAHTAREAGHISALLSVLNPKTGEVARAKPRCLLRQQTAVVEVIPARPMCLEEYSDFKALGRIALRDGGKTIAVGIVTKIVEAS